jgi:glycosyltransferase involved in cell wall biosynthesis
LDSDSYDLSCYHIADEYSFSPTEQPLDNREVELIKRVDQVFIHSQALIEKKGHFNPHTLYVTNGVDYALFAAPHDEPTDMQHIPHPRIGYVGAIKTQLNFHLLCGLATRHPAWSLVFVGPKGYLGDDAQFVEQLAAMRNVHFLGPKPVDQVCAYQQHLDVCLLPYKLNDYTKYIYPLKLHEYLAGGKPVVGTPIRPLLEFSHVIKLADTHDEWSRAITESLTPDAITIDQIEKRRAIAKQFDWGALVHTIAGSMCDRLGAPYKEQFNALNLETS